MGSFTDFLEDALLEKTLNKVAYSPTAAVYLALATADPTDTATGASMNECANSGSYARKAIVFSAAAARAIVQNGAVTFDAATGGGWGTVTHWAIVDNITYGAGNALAAGQFAASKTIVSGNTPSVATTEITVSMVAGQVSDYLSHTWLDHAFRNQAFTAPSTYVALTTVVITDGLTGTTITEETGTGYARVLVDVNAGASPTWDLAVSSNVDNTHDIDVGPATAADWGTETSTCLCDAATLGNLLFYDNAMTDQAVGDGDTVRFVAGSYDVTVT